MATVRDLGRYWDYLRRHSARQVWYRVHNRMVRRVWKPASWDLRPTPSGAVVPPRWSHPPRLDLVERIAVVPEIWAEDIVGEDIQDSHNQFRLRGGLGACLVEGYDGIAEVQRRLVDDVGALDGRVAYDPFNIALRLRELYWIAAVLDHRGDAEQARSLFALLPRHQCRLARTIEFETPGNHPLFGLYVLWLTACVTHPDGAHTPRARRAASRFEREVAASFLPDGMHCELSTHYHVQVLRLMEEYRRLTLALGRDPCPAFVQLVVRAWSVLEVLRSPAGDLPRFGDGCYCFFGHDLGDDLAALDAARPVTVADPGATTTSGLTLRLLADVRPVDPAIPAAVEVLEDGGYIVARDDRAAVRGLLVVDVGELGARRNPGHGHADQMSFTLDVGGQPLLVDPGTHRYGDREEWLWFKRALAHNTIWIDGEEPADLWRFFRWCRVPPRPRAEWEAHEHGLVVTAVRHGYGALAHLTHRRRLELEWDSGLTVVDEIESAGAILPTWGVSLHGAPGNMVDQVGTHRYVLDAAARAVRLRFVGAGSLVSCVVDETVSPRYGTIEPAVTVRAAVREGNTGERIETRLEW